MISFILGLVSGLVGLAFLSLIKTYERIPAKEVKRMARAGDEVAKLIYKPIAYGVSLPIVLWIVVGLTMGTSVVLFASFLSFIPALLIVSLLLWAGFAWIPSGELTKLGIWLAKRASGPLTWLLERVSPLLDRIVQFVRSHRPIHLHTGLYEKADLVELLQAQKGQPDNRIAASEIDLLSHALSFGDKLVGDVLVPKRVVTMVQASDVIGPILTDELHKSGHSRFPVYDAEQDSVIGILFLRDLVMNKQTGSVQNIMHSQVQYVHEDFTLFQTLQAFIKTKQHMFLVVNSFEEFVGIITIEDVIEQLTGKVIMDEFDTYEDMRAVAAAAASKEHAAHKKADREPTAETAIS